MKNLIFIVILTLLAGCSRLTVFDTDLLQAHNNERANKSLPPLESDSDLDKFAQKHAEWMASKQRLDHQSLKPLMEDWSTAGENIACGQENVEEVMYAWMHSSGHKRNILNKSFTHVGFGKATTKTGIIYWCVDFAGGDQRISPLKNKVYLHLNEDEEEFD